MEGVTGPTYRRTFHEFFTPCDKYYTPFLSPTSDHRFTARQWKEIDPETMADINLVPQLLTNNAENFLWAARELAAMGYREVNLNLGCPSGTVVKKKKGSGLLGMPDILEPMLDEIFGQCPISVSIKTRLGVEDEAEFDAILALYDRYPVSELIVHPRVTRDQYRGDVHMDAFRKVYRTASMPLCYNGNVFTSDDAAELSAEFPELSGIMLGRGAVANPGLIGYLKTGAWTTAEQMEAFHTVLYERYRATLPGLKPTLFKLRELWMFMQYLFEEPQKPLKRILKADTFANYECAVRELFRTCRFIPDGSFVPR